MLVDVLEFRLPDGREILHQIEIDDACQSGYTAICDLKGRLTCERLITDAVFQYIEFDEGDFDVTLSKGDDTTETKTKLEKMIQCFDKDEYDIWIKEIGSR